MPDIRRPLYQGMQLVHGLWFDLAPIGEAEARRRVLRHWTPGARLYDVQDGYLLMLAAPRPGHCASLDGLPLCEQAGILASAPLAADERAATPPASVWLVRGAQAHLVSLAAAPRIDPATWLDLRAIALHVPLEPPRSPRAVPGDDASTLDAAAPLEATPVREIFGDAIAPPSARRDDFLRQAGRARHGPARRLHAAGMALAAAGMAATLMGAVPLGLIRLFFGSGRHAATEATGQQQAPPPSAVRQRLAELAARVAVVTRVARLLGWRQAAYLRKMIALLEQGDTAEALRHAIPLDALSRANRPAFGLPRPRGRLEISGPGGSGASAIGIDNELEQYLRTTYRRTFERLDREGRIDEATYVLAELLKCGGEAVDYLEQKGRLKQAAQLAETVELAPEIAVRLWVMAGNVERAVQLAQLGQAFAAAVQLLERGGHPQAPALRLLWAQDLAWRGHLTEAADAVWLLPDQHRKALAWLLEAERAGGALGARALLKKLALLPASLADNAAALLQTLDDDSAHGAQQRSVLGTELLVLSQHSVATRRLSSQLILPLLADRMAGRNDFDKKALDSLLAVCADQVLKADLPPFAVAAATPAPGLNGRTAPLQVHLAERGLLPIHDVRRLPDGHYLLALGEAGVVRIDRQGRTLARFAVPATRLVMAAGGQRALALVPRDSMWRVSRIDLVVRKVSDWIIAPLRFWADHYDGLLWNAVIDNRLAAIDTSAGHMAVTWQVADFPGRVIAFLEERGTQTLLLSTAGDLQQWRYQLPARRLTQRDSFPPPRGEVLALLPDSLRDAPALVHVASSASAALRVLQGGASAPFTIALPAFAQVPEVVQAGGYLLVSGDRAQEERELTFDCVVAEAGTGKVLAQLSLTAADMARVRFDDGHILLFDQAGRLIDVRCNDSQVHTLTLT